MVCPCHLRPRTEFNSSPPPFFGATGSGTGAFNPSFLTPALGSNTTTMFASPSSAGAGTSGPASGTFGGFGTGTPSPFLSSAGGSSLFRPGSSTNGGFGTTSSWVSNSTMFASSSSSAGNSLFGNTTNMFQAPTTSSTPFGSTNIFQAPTPSSSFGFNSTASRFTFGEPGIPGFLTKPEPTRGSGQVPYRATPENDQVKTSRPFGMTSSVSPVPFPTTTNPAFAFNPTSSSNGSSIFGGFQTRSLLTQGSGVESYRATHADADDKNASLLSISAMQAFRNKSHEELRWEDHELSCNKAGQFSTSPFGGSSIFGVQSFPGFPAKSEHTRIGSGVATRADNEGDKPVLLQSISAMPSYKDKSHEELRFEDYELGRNKGGQSSTPAASRTCDATLNPFRFPNQSSSVTSPIQPLPQPNLFKSNPFLPTNSQDLVAPKNSSTIFPAWTHFPSEQTSTPAKLNESTNRFQFPATVNESTNRFQFPATPMTSTSPSPSPLPFCNPTPRVSPSTQSPTSVSPLGDSVNPHPDAGRYVPSITVDVQPSVVVSPFSTRPEIVDVKPSLVVSPFSTRPEIDRSNTVQPHGISSLPVSNKLSSNGMKPLMRIRHMSIKQNWLAAQKYSSRSGSSEPKVPFFNDDVDRPGPTPPFLPRENPMSWVRSPLLSVHSSADGKSSEEKDVPSSPFKINVELIGDAYFPEEEDLSNQVLALMPKLPDGDGYYTEPTLKEMVEKEMAEPGSCSRVKDFLVGRKGYGSIRFLGETDVRLLDIGSAVEINNREVIVYADDSKKPPVGQGLNKAAEITLLNLKCISRNKEKQYIDGPRVKSYKEMLMKKGSEQGAEFVSYDPVPGEWKFRVQHF